MKVPFIGPYPMTACDIARKRLSCPRTIPDTPEMRHDWAQYYDKIEKMDGEVGAVLRELEESGESENTIVFYYGDHGGVLARSKRYVYESGTRVPFIVHVPEKYGHLYPMEKVGGKVDRLISFVDLAPTLLSILDIQIPDFMQGKAFLGAQKTEDSDHAFMFRGRMDERYDMSRAVRDQKYRYIRNYMPYRIYGQPLEYLWRAPSVGSWEAAYRAGECNAAQSAFWETKPSEELYDTENDPWEVNNLVADPEYREVLEKMRRANRKWILEINDTGFVPEGDLMERTGQVPAYDFMRSGDLSLVPILDAAELATNPTEESISALVSCLRSDDGAIRYWGATGLLILGDGARSALKDIAKAANDASMSVSIVAAEALYRLGEESEGKKALIRALRNKSVPVRTQALNTIDCIGVEDSEIQRAVKELVRTGDGNSREYDMRAGAYLIKKWGLGETRTKTRE